MNNRKEVAIQLGDCVKLKSGGPLMTVRDVGDHHHHRNVALCRWFDGTKLKGDIFELHILIVEPQGKKTP